MARELGSNPTVAETRWWSTFLAVLRDTGQITAAATAAGVHRATVYRHLREYPQFKEQFDDAREQAVDALEAEAWRRAKDGVPRQKMVGEEKVVEIEYSDNLLKFLLQAHRPAIYRPIQTLKHEGSIGIAEAMAAAAAVADPDSEEEGEGDDA